MLLIESLEKWYRQPDGNKIQILDIPRYELTDGEQAVLIGASGGGKTTLLHCIAGITQPTKGKVVLDRMEVSRMHEATRDRIRARKIGYVFQTFHLLPGFSALENVCLGMAFANGFVDRGRAKQLLERVGLGHRAGHRPKMMSVGEQQRVAIARALANRPSLLLADEPTANVDPSNQQKIVDLIRNTCAEEKTSLLLVTHSMEVANQFSRVDQLAEINRVVGQVKEAS